MVSPSRSSIALFSCILIYAITSAVALECYRCESTVSWAACAQRVTVEECESEHPFESNYVCVTNRMNLTIPSFAFGIYATGCGWGNQDGTRKLFERILPHQHANVTIEEWSRCEADLCNSVTQYDNGPESVPPVNVLHLFGKAERKAPTLVLMGVTVGIILKNI